MNSTIKIILVLVVILIITICVIVNKIIRRKNTINRSKSVVDIHLKKRFDLIPNLIEVVKGYATYEQSTLEEIARLRNQFSETDDAEAGNKLTGYYKSMLAVVENYPDLKAQENFLQLQKTLTKIENEISAARRIYINDITRYNNVIEVFPVNILALLLGHKHYDIPEYESEDITVEF